VLKTARRVSALKAATVNVNMILEAPVQVQILVEDRKL